MRRWLLAGTGLGAVCAAGITLSVHLVVRPGPLPEATDVVVPRGGMSETAAVLRRAGVIREKFLFEALGQLTSWQGPMRAAELRFPARASMVEVLLVLRTGRAVQHRLTIAEGLTSAQIAELLARDNHMEGDIALPDEGSVLPQSYDFERGTTRLAFLARAKAAMTDALQVAWRGRAAGDGVGSLQEAVVLASLVERETALPAERPMVARVFINRLRQKMRLQSDPTVVYAASGGKGRIGRPLTRAELDEDGPYNTYTITGLPAGPICNPGLEAVRAVLHPAASAALYFVADGNGGHSFSVSLAEHERNVERYRAEQGRP